MRELQKRSFDHTPKLNTELCVGPRAESHQADLLPLTLFARQETDTPKVERFELERPRFKPWKATYASVSEDFINDKKNEVFWGFVMVAAGLLSCGLSFGRVWIGAPLFFLIYPALGMGYLWLRGKGAFANFGDFVVESTTCSLYIVFAFPAVAITGFALLGIQEMPVLSLILAVVFVIYCGITLEILISWKRFIEWVVKRVGAWRIWKRLSTSLSKAPSTPN